MADIELMTTKHSNDIITRLDKLEEQIVRKGVPKGAKIERIVDRKGTLIIEGPIRILYLSVSLSSDTKDAKLIIGDHDFEVEDRKKWSIEVYNDIYYIDNNYINGTTKKYDYYDNLSKFVQHSKPSTTTQIDSDHRGIIGENIDVNYLEVRGIGYIQAMTNIIYIKL